MQNTSSKVFAPYQSNRRRLWCLKCIFKSHKINGKTRQRGGERLMPSTAPKTALIIILLHDIREYRTHKTGGKAQSGGITAPKERIF
jgi:hypothetical protein